MARRATLDTPVNGQHVAQQTICLQIERSRFYNDRRGSIDLVDTKTTTKQRLRLTKLLIPNECYTAIDAIDAAFDTFLDNYALPSYFRRGVIAVSLSAYGPVQARLTQYIAERNAAADEFAFTTYPPERDKAPAALGDQYHAADYPSPDDVRHKFDVRYRWFETTVPITLRAADPEAYNAELAKLRATVQETAERMRQFMRAAFASFVEEFRQKMQPRPDGKKRVVHETLLARFNDFIRTFPLRNVTDDRLLATFVDDVRGLMTGIDIDAVRNDENTRALIARTMTTIANDLAPYVQTRPTRAIDNAA